MMKINGFAQLLLTALVNLEIKEQLIHSFNCYEMKKMEDVE